MSEKHVAFKDLAHAREHGFRPLAELPPDFRELAQRAIAAHEHEFGVRISACGPEHAAGTPCRDFCYKEGVREICFCSPANQCDASCVYGHCPPY